MTESHLDVLKTLVLVWKTLNWISSSVATSILLIRIWFYSQAFKIKLDQTVSIGFSSTFLEF